MQQAVPVGEGAMAAVIGLDDDQVEAACSEEEAAGRGIVRAVNFNSPGQVVIAGSAAAVAGAGERCRERGARRAGNRSHAAMAMAGRRRRAGADGCWGAEAVGY